MWGRCSVLWRWCFSRRCVATTRALTPIDGTFLNSTSARSGNSGICDRVHRYVCVSVCLCVCVCVLVRVVSSCVILCHHIVSRPRSMSVASLDDHDDASEPMMDWSSWGTHKRDHDSKLSGKDNRERLQPSDLPRHLHRVYFDGVNSITSPLAFPASIPPELEPSVRQEKYEVGWRFELTTQLTSKQPH